MKSRSLNRSFAQPKPLHLRLALATTITLAVLACAAHAQTFQVIHYFTGAQDGAYPGSALLLDRGEISTAPQEAEEWGTTVQFSR